MMTEDEGTQEPSDGEEPGLAQVQKMAAEAQTTCNQLATRLDGFIKEVEFGTIEVRRVTRP